jgi:hypothetical protein
MTCKACGTETGHYAQHAGQSPWCALLRRAHARVMAQLEAREEAAMVSALRGAVFGDEEQAG